ncbi:MAG TPA: potassium transporter TrkG, partial [Pirellulaceae bacterium]
MTQLIGSISSYPARATLLWFGGMILIGGSCLCHPLCQTGRTPVGFIENLFTATSAACVTGLSVVSTPQDYSQVGQTVVLILIQLGGIGIMTITTLIVVQLGGGNAGLRQRALVSATLGADTRADLRSILYPVILYTASIELLGFGILAVRNLWDALPWPQALWNALFHAVSAFCNAGFALHDNNLVGYQRDPVTNLAICGLIMVGGIGYPVMLDIKRNWNRPT